VVQIIVKFIGKEIRLTRVNVGRNEKKRQTNISCPMQEKEEQPSQVISKYQRRNHAAIIFWKKS
jgi:hypothetical protein